MPNLGTASKYVMFSTLGVIHLLVGFLIGFMNVLKAHGAAAASLLRKEISWILILLGGFFHARRFIAYEGDVLPQRVLCRHPDWHRVPHHRIGRLEVWVGRWHHHAGSIETFGLLANTLSYLRVMGVGVAGVKIAEVSITMGWEVMMTQFAAGGLGFLWGASHSSCSSAFRLSPSRAWPAFTQHSLPVSTSWNGWSKFLTAPGSPSPPWAPKHPCGGRRGSEHEQDPEEHAANHDRLGRHHPDCSGAAAAEDGATTTGNSITGDLAVGISLGLAAVGAGISQPPLAALPLACSPKTARSSAPR
ncbi:MAG: hypothetical protein CM15mP128_0890 [Methanobacteriota archaeon]|nr:MAG: hypothetical protein CM15mP128_0890 [Euryarchaeota archaeon]